MCEWILFVEHSFFHFEIPKRHIATFWNCSAIHIHTTHVLLLLLAFSRWSAGRNLCTFPTVCFSFNSFCFGLFVITSKKYEMYSSEMVGFSPFWRKLLAPLWKEMSEGVRRTSIYTKTELSNAKQQRKRKNPPCDERKLWSFIFEIIHWMPSLGPRPNALMLENVVFKIDSCIHTRKHTYTHIPWFIYSGRH